MITCSCYFACRSFSHHGHVDLKGEFDDLGTVPRQKNIFAPRSSLFAFLHKCDLFPHSCEVSYSSKVQSTL